MHDARKLSGSAVSVSRVCTTSVSRSPWQGPGRFGTWGDLEALMDTFDVVIVGSGINSLVCDAMLMAPHSRCSTSHRRARATRPARSPLSVRHLNHRAGRGLHRTRALAARPQHRRHHTCS